MKNLRPLLFFVALLLVVGSACKFVSGEDTPEPPPTEQPIKIDEPTAEPTELPVTEEPLPTEPPTPEAQPFFTEEFDEPLSDNWSTYIIYDPTVSDLDKVTLEADDGKLVWDFNSQYVYHYLFYGAYEYEDVQLETIADNRGKNNSAVSLICRYDPEVGWYEFNVANNGLYVINFVKVLDSGKLEWNRIANGGSNEIKAGLQTNEYLARCEGNELYLEINGAQVKKIEDKKYGHNKGLVGVSVRAFNALPVLIDMDWFRISEP